MKITVKIRLHGGLLIHPRTLSSMIPKEYFRFVAAKIK
jgi:hypothetical protein